jgi:hypothetical protein
MLYGMQDCMITANQEVDRDGVRLFSQCYKFQTSVDVGLSNRQR